LILGTPDPFRANHSINQKSFSDSKKKATTFGKAEQDTPFSDPLLKKNNPL
jgi:hypothetical protein